MLTDFTKWNKENTALSSDTFRTPWTVRFDTPRTSYSGSLAQKENATLSDDAPSTLREMLSAGLETYSITVEDELSMKAVESCGKPDGGICTLGAWILKSCSALRRRATGNFNMNIV